MMAGLERGMEIGMVILGIIVCLALAAFVCCALAGVLMWIFEEKEPEDASASHCEDAGREERPTGGRAEGASADGGEGAARRARNPRPASHCEDAGRRRRRP